MIQAIKDWLKPILKFLKELLNTKLIEIQRSAEETKKGKIYILINAGLLAVVVTVAVFAYWGIRIWLGS